MAEGVTQVQQIPLAPVEFIRHHDIPLVTDTGGNDPLPVEAQTVPDQLLKEISPEYSLGRLMLKLKHQYFGHHAKN